MYGSGGMGGRYGLSFTGYVSNPACKQMIPHRRKGTTLLRTGRWMPKQIAM